MIHHTAILRVPAYRAEVGDLLLSTEPPLRVANRHVTADAMVVLQGSMRTFAYRPLELITLRREPLTDSPYHYEDN